ncbi:hypothetical protein N7456_001120 [Penicillium angulare]|uniref:Uncharacterized protein n=1 Tax=Penicillium angulare TaxID=116970 RepID=A0A9W9GDH5_9EURO|nr:hypothetical protein N7456_001120 [Penicillium angulare]
MTPYRPRDILRVLQVGSLVRLVFFLTVIGPAGMTTALYGYIYHVTEDKSPFVMSDKGHSGMSGNIEPDSEKV